MGTTSGTPAGRAAGSGIPGGAAGPAHAAAAEGGGAAQAEVVLGASVAASFPGAVVGVAAGFHVGVPDLTFLMISSDLHNTSFQLKLFNLVPL